MALFVRCSWVGKFLFLSRVVNIVCRRDSSDDAAGWVWGVPRFKDIPLGPAKVLGLRFLGYVASGLLNLQKGISFVF